MGTIALSEHITAFFARAEKPSEDINSHLFLMNKKGFKKSVPNSHYYLLQAVTPDQITQQNSLQRAGAPSRC
jgi:hypothetical protein